MKTVLINADDSMARIFLELARKLNFKARVLSKEEREDAVLLSMMEKRKNEATVPVAKTLEILRRAK